MRTQAWAACGAATLLVATLTSCSSSQPPASTPQKESSSHQVGKDTISPLSMRVEDLQDAQVDLVIGQMLIIDTQEFQVDSFTGKVEDNKVAEFIAGKKDDSTQFFPGVSALTKGSTKVTITHTAEDPQEITFTVKVTPRD